MYDAAPEVVYFGYTPGYLGTCVSDGVVVFGTGYVYEESETWRAEPPPG